MDGAGIGGGAILLRYVVVASLLPTPKCCYDHETR